MITVTTRLVKDYENNSIESEYNVIATRIPLRIESSKALSAHASFAYSSKGYRNNIHVGVAVSGYNGLEWYPSFHVNHYDLDIAVGKGAAAVSELISPMLHDILEALPF